MCIPAAAPPDRESVRVAEIDAFDGPSAPDQGGQIDGRETADVSLLLVAKDQTEPRRQTPDSSFPPRIVSSRPMPPPMPSKTELSSSESSREARVSPRADRRTPAGPLASAPFRTGSKVPRSVTNPPPAHRAMGRSSTTVTCSSPGQTLRTDTSRTHGTDERRFTHGRNVDPKEPAPHLDRQLPA